jgi:hypothetical protein
LGKANSRPNLTSRWHQCWKVYLHGGFLEPASPVLDMKILKLILAFILYLSQAFFHCCTIVIQNSPFCACIFMSLVQVEAC